mmetsp:Transcript_1549/g.5694  ORF Transcript_1549/g.5694 Transcript_1549/m.5694 type:complete len:345 (+) Transcript_1549:377-1411(+)
MPEPSAGGASAGARLPTAFGAAFLVIAVAPFLPLRLPLPLPVAVFAASSSSSAAACARVCARVGNQARAALRRGSRRVEERMGEELFAREALDGIALEEAADEVDARGGELRSNLGRDPAFGALDVLEELDVVLPAERRAADENLKEDGAHAPQVRLGVVLFVLQNLRGHVERRAAQRLGHPLRLERPCKSKVRNLQLRHRRCFGQEEVLGLKVAVDVIRGPEHLQTRPELLHHVPRNSLRHSPVPPHEVRQVATRAEFKHQKQLVRLLDDVVELDDVGRVGALQREHLGLERLFELGVETLKVNLLDRGLAPIILVASVPHHSEGARTNLAEERPPAHDALRL